MSGLPSPRRGRSAGSCPEQRLVIEPIVGLDAGFFKRMVVQWYLGVAESMGHAPKMWQCENWNLTENVYTRNTGNAGSK